MNRIYTTTKGSEGQSVLFLHGLWGGGNYFRHFDFIPEKEFISFFPDELGFGKSEKPNISYTPKAHVNALVSNLPSNKKYTIIAHSFGTILAVYFATLYPEFVNKLILISPLIYQSSSEAKQYLSTRFITNLTLKHPMAAKTICKSLCSTGILGTVAPFFVRNRKKRYIRGCTEHTWHSYYSTFMECGVKSPTFDLIENLPKRIPISLVYGKEDNYINPSTFKKIPSQISQTLLDGGHNVLFKSFDQSKKILYEETK